MRLEIQSLVSGIGRVSACFFGCCRDIALVVLFSLVVTSSALPDESNSNCVLPGPLQSLSPTNIIQKLCDIAGLSSHIELSISYYASYSGKRNSLLSSKFEDYLLLFRAASAYKIEPIKSQKLFRLSVVDENGNESSLPAGIASYLSYINEEETWVRCSEKCVIYRDIDTFTDSSARGVYCKVIVQAVFDNPPTDEMLNIALTNLKLTSETMSKTYNDDLLKVCHLGH